MRGDDLLFGLLFICVVANGVGWLVTADNRDALKRQAIMHGYASYCPQTGEWAWKGECDD